MAEVLVWFYQGTRADAPVLKEPHLAFDSISSGGFIEIPPGAELAAIETDAATYYNVTPDSGKDITTGDFPSIPITAGKRFVIDVSRGDFLVLADV